MKQRGGVYNQLAPRRKNSPKLNKALLIINSVLFVCSLVVGVLYIQHGEPRSSISMFLISVVTIFNARAAGGGAVSAKGQRVPRAGSGAGLPEKIF